MRFLSIILTVNNCSENRCRPVNIIPPKRPHSLSYNNTIAKFFFEIRVSLNASNIFLAMAMLFQISSSVSVVTVFLSIFFSTLTKSDEVPPSLAVFVFSWLDDKEIFAAGDIATIKIKVLGNFNNDTDLLIDGHFPNLTLMVNEKMGNSSFISGVSSALQGDSSSWNISFIPISVGTFNVLIDDERFKISDSSLHFQVLPGRMYPSVCVASWRGLVNEFVAGTVASVLILPKDAFGNNVSSTNEEPNSYKFMVSAFYENGSIGSVLNASHTGWNGFGYVSINFIASTIGNFLLHIAGGSQTLNGAPLPFKVKPGLLDIRNCLAKWNYDTNALQIFSKLEIFIHQQDQFGNLVPGLYEFDAQVVEKGTKLPIPIADLYFKEVAPGIQLFSFSVIEPGDFVLTVFDMKQNQSILNMPYHYTVFVGYCDGVNSVLNGSGLTSSIAGIASSFSVYLEDMYHNPSPVEAERLRVQIIRNSDAYNVLPSIFPKQIVEGNRHRRNLSYGASGFNGSALAPSFDPKNTSGTDLKVQTSAFDVIYIPEKSGRYEIRVFCGNIPLNGGHSYTMEVTPGDVDMELSEVMQFVPKVPKLVRNEIVVQLMDSCSNPIPLQQTKLSLEFRSVNNSGSVLWTFEDKKDGLYIGYYLAKDIGAYEICISFDGKHLSPCPFWTYVYSSEYFPKTYDDTISVWEDESVSFDALENDYFAGGSANIIEFSTPNHGSLLQYGRLFRYTPHKGFFGNDSFSYSISDINNNSVSGTAIISVLITPPQFVSLPVQLQATEDVLSPRFGGFSGFEIQYSDSIENISITLTALSGTVFLSPMLMQFWQPTWSELVVDREENEGKGLIIVGCIEVINSALQSIQYLGNENFYGNDVIKASTMNKNGIHDTHVPLYVEPINDPPYIRVPEFIMLEKGSQYSSQIFNEKRDKFEFSIGDPDMFNFPGSESQFMITLSLEVDAGILLTSLPAVFINTTELKLKNSYQWQPLQTFVTISKHFAVKGKGIRFRGTMKDCNSAMQHLFYQGGEHGAVLTVTVNDMGNYGCYHPDCLEKLSAPLFTEANVNLIRRKPMSSIMAHTLGSVILIEFFTIFFLGALLLFFVCKCALVLSNERRSSHTTGSKLLSEEKFQKPSSPTSPSENVTYFTGCCSSPFWFRRQPSSNFRQRSCRKYGIGEANKHPSQSSNDHCQLTPLNNLTSLTIEKEQKETV